MANQQRVKFEKDVDTYSDYQKGVYRGIEYVARRPNFTYWCGYIYPDSIIEAKLTNEDYEELEKLSHHGLTAQLGFDCAHYDDWYENNSNLLNSVYRDFPYVKKKLCDMIDYIMDKYSR